MSACHASKGLLYSLLFPEDMGVPALDSAGHHRHTGAWALLTWIPSCVRERCLHEPFGTSTISFGYTTR